MKTKFDDNLLLTRSIRLAGMPLLNLRKGLLSGCTISSVRGILSGTSNYILTEMEKGISYEEALKQIQPIEENDSASTLEKISIIVSAMMDMEITLKDIVFKGISQLSKEQFEMAKEQNARWKLVATINKTKSGVEAHVEPEMIEISNPLSAVNGTSDAITFTTDHNGNLTVIGTTEIHGN